MLRGLLCLSLTLTLCSTAWSAPPKILTGKVVVASAGKLVMTKADETELNFVIDERTVILVNNQPARLEGLKRGSFIRLTIKDGRVDRIETVGTIEQTADRKIYRV